MEGKDSFMRISWTREIQEKASHIQSRDSPDRCKIFGLFCKYPSKCTLIKKFNKICLIYKEIQNGAVAKSYMTNGLLIYLVKYLRIFSYIRKPFLIYDFATAPFWISLYIYEENLIFFFFLFDQCSHFLSYVAELSASWQRCCRPESLISQGLAGRAGVASAGSFDGGPPRGRRRPAGGRWWGAAGSGPRPLLSGCTWPPPPGRGLDRTDRTCMGVICMFRVMNWLEGRLR